MAKLNYQANYNIKFIKGKGNIKLSIDIYQFIEKGIHYLYSPQLDVHGYGKSEKESLDSFNTSLSEFFRYTLNKDTLDKVLTGLGWKLKKKNWSGPELETLLRDNEEFQEILHKKEYKKITRNVPVPELVNA